MKNETLAVPIARTNLLDHELQAVLEPLKSGWLVQGPKVAEFERKWSQFTDIEHSIAVTSCTSGLHLSLAALDIRPGDEVIVPAFTWISTANVVEHLGATVVFCDIDLTSFNIDVEKIEQLITPKTKAIIPVHLFGLSANMKAIVELASKYDLYLIEDAACGFGATYGGKHVGGAGDTGVFSFHPRKAITTGEGGMVTTNDAELATKIRCFRDHGASISDRQRHLGPKPYLLSDHAVAGYNQRMTDFQAALGSAQMDRAESIVSERIRLASIYDKALMNSSILSLPESPLGFRHGYQSFPCMFKRDDVLGALANKDDRALASISEERNALMDRLQSVGISTRPATHAVHMLQYYRQKYNVKAWDFPYAMAANNCSLSIPLFHGMTSEEQKYVIEHVLHEG